MRIVVVFLTILLSVATAVAASPATAAANTLFEKQQRQKMAISRERNTVVNVKAYNTNANNRVGNRLGIEKVGSGVIINRAGYVITNLHVVSGFDTVEVGVLFNGVVNYFPAEIIKLDEIDDLALLKITEDQVGRFVVAELASKQSIEQLTVGEQIFVIGNPYGYHHTVTKGIISKVQRTISIDGVTYNDMIQTDASINQGNSGGAVINMQGEVIGITTAIFSMSKSSNGLGFAIPINRVQKFIDTTLGPLNNGNLLLAKSKRVAAVTVKNKEKINLNEPVPHKFLGDCTKCHTITFKTLITAQERMPHPFMGACSKCHTIVKKKPGIVLNVAQTNDVFNDPNATDKTIAQLTKANKEYLKDKMRMNYRLPNGLLILYTLILVTVVATFTTIYIRFLRQRNLQRKNR